MPKTEKKPTKNSRLRVVKNQNNAKSDFLITDC